MSTIKVNKIENTATADGGISIDATGHVQIDGVQLPTAGTLSNRNLVINGGMQVSQRSTSTAVTTTDTFVLDRFKTASGSSFNFNSTISQSSTAPAGFANSYKVDVTSTSTPTGGQNGVITHAVEAQNLQHLQYGASTAQTCTLTFHVRSNKTGTYCIQILHHDADKYQLHEYTISSADTWEQKTITIVGNTADAITNDTGIGFHLRWHLAAGSSDHVSASSTWTGSNQSYFTTSNQVNLFDNTSNEWYLTGVQLEVGEKATPFEHRSYGDELARCQRYFQRISGDNDAYTYPSKGQGSDSVDATIPLCVPLRASPTMNAIDSRAFTDSSSFAASSSTAPTANHFSANNPHLAVNCGGFSGLTNNEVSVWGPRSNALEIDAEL